MEVNYIRQRIILLVYSYLQVYKDESENEKDQIIGSSLLLQFLRRHRLYDWWLLWRVHLQTEKASPAFVPQLSLECSVETRSALSFES